MATNPPPNPSSVTTLLAAAHNGDDAARRQLFAFVYEQIRALARARRADERGHVACQTTELVHEAYLKLVQPGADWETKAHFFGAAANALRQILIEAARRRDLAARKQGHGRTSVARVSDADDAGWFARAPGDIMALDDALLALEHADPQRAQVVKLRYFAGLSVDQTANVLQLHPKTVQRSWASARAWLHQHMTSHPVGRDGHRAKADAAFNAPIGSEARSR